MNVERFSVILTIDVPYDEQDYRYPVDSERAERWYTPEEGEWDITEDEWEDEWGMGWEDGWHRKFASVVDREDFEGMLEQYGLYADCKTMGSLGAPGMGFGLVPAVSFHADDPHALVNAYVTPFPPEDPNDHEDQLCLSEELEELRRHDWETVETWLFRTYGP